MPSPYVATKLIFSCNLVGDGVSVISQTHIITFFSSEGLCLNEGAVYYLPCVVQVYQRMTRFLMIVKCTMVPLDLNLSICGLVSFRKSIPGCTLLVRVSGRFLTSLIPHKCTRISAHAISFPQTSGPGSVVYWAVRVPTFLSPFSPLYLLRGISSSIRSLSKD